MTEPVADHALATLAHGDEAWWAGDRRTAKRDWQGALAEVRAADGVRSRAVEAMARVRLLQVSGTFGPFLHEGRLRTALGVCLAEEPWCAIARADAELWMPAFTGASPARVPGVLAGSPLLGPAAARIAVATGDQTALHAVRADDLDGLGRGILATGRPRPPNPGTWSLGVGVAAAPGAGAGASLRYLNPDLAWHAHTLTVLASGDTLGGYGLTADLVTGTRPSLLVRGSVARARGYLWADDTPSAWSLDTVLGSVGLAVRSGAFGVSAGVTGRRDDVGAGALFAVGPHASLTLGDSRAWTRFTADSLGGDYLHLALAADARAYPSVAGGTLALRGVATVVPTAGSPFYLLPAAGGANLLRGAPAGRYRSDSLFGAQAELRHGLVGPLEGAAFVDTVSAGEWNWTAGAGLRLVLPPGRTNVTRLDVGFGPGTWGVTVGWGDAF